MIEENPECCRRSFGASIKDTAKRLLEDPTVAPRKIAESRMELCKSCPHFKESSKTCDMCNCFMPLKTTMANVACPVGKWVEWKRAD